MIVSSHRAVDLCRVSLQKGPAKEGCIGFHLVRVLFSPIPWCSAYFPHFFEDESCWQEPSPEFALPTSRLSGFRDNVPGSLVRQRGFPIFRHVEYDGIIREQYKGCRRSEE